MKKPVISLDLMHLHSNVSFIKNRKAIVISNSSDLLSAIEMCLANTDKVKEIVEKGKIFAEQELGVMDGKAAERIVKLILDLKSEKSPLEAARNIGSP